MAKLKVSKTRRANQKAALALYNIMEAHSKKLGKELKALERRNNEYQKNILIRTLAFYGAEDDIEVWAEQSQSGVTKINKLLNERWKVVQDRLMIVEQQRKVMKWGQTLLPATSIAAQRAEKGKRQTDPENIAHIPRNTSNRESPIALVDNRAGSTTQDFNVGFKVNTMMLKKLLGSKSEKTGCKEKRPAQAGPNSLPSEKYSNGGETKALMLKKPSLHNEYKDKVSMLVHLGNVKMLDCESTINVKKSKTDDEVMDIDEDSENEGLPLELLENPALLLAQARVMKQQHFAKLTSPIRFRFLLERGDDCPFWGMYISNRDFPLSPCCSLHHIRFFSGMTLSLFDQRCLIVGHLCQRLLLDVTKSAKGSYTAPTSNLLNSQPDEFFDSFKESFDGPHELKPGDIILSINGRPSHMFSTLLAVTEYIKRFRSMCLVVLRVQESPTNPDKDSSYELTRDCYVSLRNNNLLSMLIGPTDDQKMPSRSPVQMEMRQNNTEILEPRLHWNETHKFFDDKHGKSILLQKCFHFEVEGGTHTKGYFETINIRNFYHWLKSRKETWRKKWTITPFIDTSKVKAAHLPIQWSNTILNELNGNRRSYVYR